MAGTIAAAAAASALGRGSPQRQQVVTHQLAQVAHVAALRGVDLSQHGYHAPRRLALLLLLLLPGAVLLFLLLLLPALLLLLLLNVLGLLLLLLLLLAAVVLAVWLPMYVDLLGRFGG